MNNAAHLDLEAMRSVDIRTVDPATLMDIQDTTIDTNKPLQERMVDFIRQIRNPYCYRYGKMTVKISYSNTAATMEERMEGYLRSL